MQSNKLTIHFPSSYDEITLQQYSDIVKAITSRNDDMHLADIMELNCELASIMTGHNIGMFTRLSLHQYAKVKDSVSFIYAPWKGLTRPLIEHEGLQWKPLGKVLAGDFIDIVAYREQNRWVEIASVILRVHDYDPDYAVQYADKLRSLPAGAALPHMVRVMNDIATAMNDFPDLFPQAPDGDKETVGKRHPFEVKYGWINWVDILSKHNKESWKYYLNLPLREFFFYVNHEMDRAKYEQSNKTRTRQH